MLVRPITKLIGSLRRFGGAAEFLHLGQDAPQHGVGDRETRIQFHRALEERDRGWRSFRTEQRLVSGGVRLKGLERRCRGLLERHVEALERSQRFTESLAKRRRDAAERIEDVILV